MAMSTLSSEIKQALGKFWRAYIVDECPAEDWKLFEGRAISAKNSLSPVVSTQVPFPSFHLG